MSVKFTSLEGRKKKEYTKPDIKLTAFLGFSEKTNTLFWFGFCCCDKTLAKTNLRKESIYLAYRLQSAMERSQGRPETDRG